MEVVILELCARRPLTVAELGELLGRNPDALRNKYLTALVRLGRLRLTYPDRPNHPQQAYVTAKTSS